MRPPEACAVPTPSTSDGRGLYAITPEGLSDAALLQAVAAALAGGLRFLQYRDKTTDPVRRLRLARALQQQCQRHAAALIINDDIDLALQAGAAGVHLGADDGDLALARRRLPAHMWLGASCYADLDRARRARDAGANYLAFGAMYPSPTKPRAPVAAASVLQQCRDQLQLPVCAIGGITLARAPALLAAGADLLAVVSDLFGAADITAHARAYQRLFAENPSHDLA